jgi:parallel beta-helix repeat protein
LRHKLLFGAVFAFLLMSSPILTMLGFNLKIDVLTASGYTIHNLNTGLDYVGIQAAIDAPETLDGHTIFVENGVYYENVVVDKALSLTGENKETTIIDGNHAGNVVTITASSVNIAGFTIRNSGANSNAGILIGRLWDMQSFGNNISGNVVMNNYYGILLAESFNSTVSSNIVTNNTIGVQDQSRDYDCDIWTMSADGSNQTLLTTEELWDDGPEWSPNDSKILFERISNPFNENGMWDIWVMNTDGTNQTRLTTDSAVNMLGGWSPNCSLIVYSSRKSGNDDVWIMDSDGTNQRQLTTDPGPDSMPTWSLDGTKIAFISNRTGNQDIWIMNADGTDQTQLTIGIPLVMGGSWSPDSSKIVFHSIEGGWNGNWDIWTINSDGTNPTKLFSSPSREAFPHWSPDGTKIAYGSDEAGSWDIWIMNPDGTNRSRITTEWDTEEICSWSPDSSKLAFARAEFSLPSYNRISNNIITDNEQEGVRLQQAVGVSLEKNFIRNNGHGLTVQQGHGHSIINNTITNNTEGIAPGGFAGAGIGIYLNMAGSNVLRNNSMSDNRYNFCIDAQTFWEFLNDMDESNTVNGKPVYYWVNQKTRQVPTDASCVLLVNSTDILVENLNVSNRCGFGVMLWSTTNSTLRNVISTGNANGISLTLSSGNTVENNTVTDIFPQGGIWLVNSPFNTLKNNIILNSTFSFLVLSQRPPPDASMQDWDNDIDDSNRIDGKPIYYLVNQHDMTVPEDGALVYLINCSNVTVRDISVSNNFIGIALVNTNSSVVTNVTTQICSYGILLAWSDDNLISNSTMTNGAWQSIGAFLYDGNNNTLSGNIFSNMAYTFQMPGQPPAGTGLAVAGVNNRVFHNNFVNNTLHVGIAPGEPLVNDWDDGYPSGGNYYSGYTGSDIFNGLYQNETGSDGIGDTPYLIDANNHDDFPLMKPYGIKHDIGVTSVATTKTIVGQGYSLNVSARIVNYGMNAETFNVTIHANTTSVASQTITLGNGTSTTITFSWNTTGFAKGNYSIDAEAESVPGETDTADNTLLDGWIFVAMPGDINADGIMDIFDIATVALAFGSTPSDPNWNSIADINNDNIVDIFDIVVVALHFGETS